MPTDDHRDDHHRDDHHRDDDLYGKTHHEVLARLADGWWPSGRPVCFLQGFPGVGKTNALLPRLRRRLGARGVEAVTVEVPEPGGGQLADLFFDLAQELRLVGFGDLAGAVDRGDGTDQLKTVFQGLLRRPVLVVWDEFQHALDPGSGEPLGIFRDLLGRLARRPEWPGRLLLLTNRHPRRGPWADAHDFETLPALDDVDGRAFLDRLLADRRRQAEVEPARRDDVVAWVGGNPRALQLVVSALAGATLDELVGLAPEAWKNRQRAVSEQLVRDLERALLEKVLARLEPESRRLLLRASALRKPAELTVFNALTPEGHDPEAVRRLLVDRFLLAHNRRWYALNAVAREVGRHVLADDVGEWRHAHAVAGAHYARHFRARRITGGDRGGDFVEARYHLVQAGREDEIGELVGRYAAHLRREIGWVTPVPRGSRALDERVATLSALLEEGGGKGLEYHLARCLAARGREEDGERALRHARRATGEKAPHAAWLLRADLEARQGSVDDALNVIREGFRCLGPNRGGEHLFNRGAEILAAEDRFEDAIDLLRQGIDVIPADKSLHSLYQSAGEMLARQGKLDAAIDLLRRGLEAIPKGRFMGWRVAEAALYLSLAAGRQDLLDELLDATGTGSLDEPQRCLARVLRLQLEDDWPAAADLARDLRRRHPRYLQLAIQEAFSWLCAGKAAEAQAAFDAFDFRRTPDGPVAWLACWIALRAGDADRARELYGIYLDRLPTAVEPPATRDLIRLWDAPVPLSTPHPSFYHPILPPPLTGLPRPLVRPPTRESVFAETPTPSATAVADGGRTVLAVASEWFSRHGGLSTLNRELCAALVAAGHRVACLVPAAGDDELADAERRGVLLVPGRATPGGDPLHRPAPVPAGLVPDLVVGHGRVTGPAAVAQAEDAFAGAARVHVVHMAPGEIEWHKDEPGAAARAEDRERLELDLCRGAAVVAAVGPRLAREAKNLLAALDAPPPVVRLDPGLAAAAGAGEPPAGLHVLLLGRAEDLELKGLDVAAAAIARLTHLDARPFASEPILVIRGAPAGKGDPLRERLLEVADTPGLQIRVREYTADVERLTADLRRSSLVLMPSRAEGFGLVGFEAIAAGVPVLLSDRSGLGELLTERLPVADRASFVVRVTGDLTVDAKEWARAVEPVLRHPRAAFTRAGRLRETLAAELDWDVAIAGIFAALDSS